MNENAGEQKTVANTHTKESLAQDLPPQQPETLIKRTPTEKLVGIEADILAGSYSTCADPLPIEPFQAVFDLVGWVFTAIAASLGAPFWFDTLNKFMNVRAAGPAPNEKNSGKSKS